MNEINIKNYQENDIINTDEGLLFNPYNPLNNEITLGNVQSILIKYGIESPIIHNLQLYRRAFIHKSYTKKPHLLNEKLNITIAKNVDNCLPLSTKSNERLEYLGDGVLELITKFYIYRRFPKEQEGFMTEKKIEIVKNEAIGKIALEMGLHKWIILSKHAEEKNIRTNLKKLGCLFEAFLGALFLDYNKLSIGENEWFDEIFKCGPGFQMAQIFVENIFEQHINWTELIQNNENYKNLFQVKIQKEFKVTPTYIQLDLNDENGYTMGVYLNIGYNTHELDNLTAIASSTFNSFNEMQEYCENNNGKMFVFYGKGTHKTKKKAEQYACKLGYESVMKYINIESNEI
jgi:dsRNA-specific ribonuclease